MDEYGVFKVGTIDVCYGGPFDLEQARMHKEDLERRISFLNEEELKLRRFIVKPMAQGVSYPYWDGTTIKS